jgi:hypothetical protein
VHASLLVVSAHRLRRYGSGDPFDEAHTDLNKRSQFLQQDRGCLTLSGRPFVLGNAIASSRRRAIRGRRSPGRATIGAIGYEGNAIGQVPREIAEGSR